MKVLIIANNDMGLYKFRRELLKELVKEHEVTLSLPNGEFVPSLVELGCVFESCLLMDRHGTNPVKELKLISYYKRLLRKVKPDIVLTYTIKPNVYGGMAAAAMKIPYVANITGLGAALGNKSLMQKLTLALYRYGFRKISRVFFQNAEDRAFFESHRLALGKHASLPGSGVNLEKFHLLDYPPADTVEFAFISRIRKDKGIEQYVDAARAIKAKYPNTRFHVCGFGDDYYEERMKQLHEEGVIVYHGLMKDVRVMLKDVHCVIHPTYYPEGMSNVLLESAASGRAIISTDRAGCREAIDHGVNGYLVREQDSSDLIEKVEQFMQLTYEEKKTMGLKGREKVAREFDRNIVVNRYLETVAELTDKSN